MKFLLIITTFISFLNYNLISFDLTIVGQLDFVGSISRIPIGIIDCLKNDLKINFVPTNIYSLKHLSNEIKNIVTSSDKTAGKVILLTEINYLWLKGKHDHKVPDGFIKIAYSMLESSLIPQIWVDILNNLDAVAVPDQWLVDVYKNSGVNVPVFVLPLGIYLDEFSKKEVKPKRKNEFVFGCSAGDWDRKNLNLIVDSFYKAFCNSKKIFLKIHSRHLNNKIKIKLNKLNCKNIKLLEKGLNQNEYIEFLSSLNCYVLLSKGEGFSITPRESLALGIPCIISNNTAHQTICDSGWVLSVKSEIQEPAYHSLFKQFCGYQYNCKIQDVVNAMKEMINNYFIYYKQAQFGRAWVKQYNWKNLKDMYLTLFKPKKVIFGDINLITHDTLITSSKQLYDKYLSLNNYNK